MGNKLSYLEYLVTEDVVGVTFKKTCEKTYNVAYNETEPVVGFILDESKAEKLPKAYPYHLRILTLNGFCATTNLDVDNVDRIIDSFDLTQLITSYDELKKWNVNPTTKLPIVYEWFMGWFFEEVVESNDPTYITEVNNTHIEFAMICNNMSLEEAKSHVDGNMEYYKNYYSVDKINKYNQWRDLH